MKRKRMYLSPEVEVLELKVRNGLLAGSTLQETNSTGFGSDGVEDGDDLSN